MMLPRLDGSERERERGRVDGEVGVVMVVEGGPRALRHRVHERSRGLRQRGTIAAGCFLGLVTSELHVASLSSAARKHALLAVLSWNDGPTEHALTSVKASRAVVEDTFVLLSLFVQRAEHAQGRLTNAICCKNGLSSPTVISLCAADEWACRSRRRRDVHDKC